MKTLIIAEKPSVAQSIASALGATKRQDGFFEGNGYFVSFAFGHLYSLADSKDYNPDMENWDLDNFPFIPNPFKYKPINDPGVKKQLKIIKELIDQSDLIINGCDFEREGDMIFYEIINNLKANKPIKRLCLTSHTPKDVQKGIEGLREPIKCCEQAAYCRQQLDWIIGINFTSVYTLKTGGDYTLKVGRVVLPTLKLIFDRDAEISNFKAVPYYALKCIFKSNDEAYPGTYILDNNTRFSEKESLLAIQKDIKDQPGIVINKTSKKAYENPSKLFNLSDLQGHITDKFKGFTSDKVLTIMQSLYEKKYLTYPRTGSRYLDESQILDVQESLKSVISMPEFTGLNKVVFHSEKRVFDSSKVDGHPAIIPTYIIPNLLTLSEEECIVYIEVAKRFLSQFMPAAVYDTVEIITKVKSHDFITKGRVLITEGWKELYKKLDSDENNNDPDQEDKITAKNINQGDSVTATESELKENITKPPAHYTEKTLLLAMENCGKNVENEEDVLKGFMIGTAATRAETLKKLFDCTYINRSGKYLIITELGAKIIHFFPVKRLLKVDFTGQIEKTLKDMENGNYDSIEFMDKMSSFIVKSINDMKTSELPLFSKPITIIGKCPGCGKSVSENTKAFSCEGTRSKECSFTLWKDDKFFSHFGKKLTLSIATDLINKGKATVKGLKSPKNKDTKFDAIISLKKNPDNEYWGYDMEFLNNKPGVRRKPTKG